MPQPDSEAPTGAMPPELAGGDGATAGERKNFLCELEDLEMMDSLWWRIAVSEEPTCPVPGHAL